MIEKKQRPQPPQRVHPVKTEVRIHTLREVGADVEDMLEAAQKTATEAEGGMKWLQQANAGLTSIEEHLNKAFKDDKVPDKMSAHEATQFVKGYIKRMRQSLTDLAVQATSEKMGQTAMAEGYQKVVGVVKKKVDSDVLRLEKLLHDLRKEREAAKATEGQPSEEQPPQHEEKRPRTSAAAEDLERRKAEAKAAKGEAPKAAEKSTRSRKKAKKKVAKKKVVPKRRSDRKGGRQRGAANS